MSYASRKGRQGKNKAKYKSELNGATFSMLRHDLEPIFRELPPNALKVLIMLMMKYRAKPNNNGSFFAVQTKAGARVFGMTERTLTNALKELQQRKLIEVSKQGGRNKNTMYALTFYPIGEQGGDLAPTAKPSDKWKTYQPQPP